MADVIGVADVTDRVTVCACDAYKTEPARRRPGLRETPTGGADLLGWMQPAPGTCQPTP